MTAPDAWNPEQYERFRAEREQPFRDLAALVQTQTPSLLVDLGCGTGELTAALHRRLAARRTVGVDSSPAMLERARACEDGAVGFVLADLATWTPDAPVDVLFSNAALQWVPGHATLLPHLLSLLAPHGELAVQMPANFDHPSHAVAAEVAAEEPFASALAGYRRVVPVLAPEAYATLLHEAGCSEQQVRLQVYGHALRSTGSVVEWVRGTLLTDYERRLSPALYAQFVERYRERLLAALGERSPYFYAFKRLLIRARRGG